MMRYLKKEVYNLDVIADNGVKIDYVFTVEFEKNGNEELRLLIFREVSFNGKDDRDAFSFKEYILKGDEANKKFASKKAERYIKSVYKDVIKVK